MIARRSLLGLLAGLPLVAVAAKSMASTVERELYDAKLLQQRPVFNDPAHTHSHSHPIIDPSHRHGIIQPDGSVYWLTY